MAMRAQVASTFNEIVGGAGARITRQPTSAASVALTASGTKYIFKAANANTIAILAAAVLLTPFRIVGVLPDTPSAVSTWYNFMLGGISVATKAINHAVEVGFWFQQVTAVGVYAVPMLPISFPPTIPIDGVNDGIGGDLATNNAAGDTCNVAVYVRQGMGS